MHVGSGHTLAQRGGEASHTITIPELPQHTHFMSAANNGATTGTPTSSLMLAKSTPQNLYASAGNPVAMAPNAVSNAGGSQAHINLQPYLTISFCIALQGIFPSQN